MKLMKIGIIAGAFDPMHSGHIDFIGESIRKYGLDKVLVLIERKSKFKKSYAAFNHRKQIAELSTAENPKIELYESLSASFPLSSTLPEIISEFDGEFYLLICDDVKEHILSWPDAADIFKDVRFIVADRKQSKKYRQVSSGKVRDQIKAGSKEVDMQKDALDYCRRNDLYN